MDNLMEFLSPTMLLSPNKQKQQTNINSPGFNPFDDALRKSVLTANMQKSVTHSNRSDLFDSNISDGGRESLGILHDFNLNISDTGRDSLGFLNLDISDFAGRESLGILNINSPQMMGGEIETEVDEVVSVLDTAMPLSRRKNSSFYGIQGFDSPTKLYNMGDKNVFKVSDVSSPKRKSDQFDDLFSLADVGMAPKDKPRNNSVVNNFDENDTEFNNSMFIEAQHFASKIADGSILDETFILDCTPQPDWPDLSDSDDEESQPLKCAAKTVFKTVDKLLPPQSTINNLNLDKAVVNIAPEPKEANKRQSRRSMEARKMLNNLNEIFNADHRTVSQKCEGKHLLHNLVDLLNNSKLSTSQDSGHSSLEEHDIKQKSQIKVVQSKLKPKIDFKSVGTKKGPLKAIIPVQEMTRKTEVRPGTPIKSSSLQSKRLSSPVMGSKIKPLAQSTPTSNKSVLKMKEFGLSPLARSRKLSIGNKLDMKRLSTIPAVKPRASLQPAKPNEATLLSKLKFPSIKNPGKENAGK